MSHKGAQPTEAAFLCLRILKLHGKRLNDSLHVSDVSDNCRKIRFYLPLVVGLKLQRIHSQTIYYLH